MVAHVLRLRLDLLLGTFRGGARRFVVTLVVALAGIAALVVIVNAVLGLSDVSLAAAETVTVLGGAAITLGFALGPIVVGAEDPLDPRRLATFGLPTAALPGTLALAGLLSVPVLALAVVAGAAAVMWTERGASGSAAWGGAILVIVTSILLARVSAAVSAKVLRGRRNRELTGVFIVALLAVMVPVGLFLASLEWRGSVPDPLVTAATIAGDAPFGAAWAIAAEEGATGGWIPVVVALATVVVLWGLWELLVRVLLLTPDRAPSVRERVGLGWFIVLPGTPAGVIAARSLIYWLRDGRYLVNLVIVPIAGIVVTVPMLVAGLPPALVALAPIPVIALFFGWLPHNDTAYDSTAVWMHVSSAVSGISDRIGRLVPVVLVSVPVLAIAIPLALVIHGDWTPLPALVGVSAALLGAGLGLSSVSSALSPYPVSRPGDGPFQQPQTAGRSGFLAQATVLFGALAAASPVIVTAWIAITADPSEGSTALWSGLGIGVGMLVVGVVLGGLAFQRRGSALMEFAETV